MEDKKYDYHRKLGELQMKLSKEDDVIKKKKLHQDILILKLRMRIEDHKDTKKKIDPNERLYK